MKKGKSLNTVIQGEMKKEFTLNENLEENFNVDKNIEYWLKMSDNDYETMLDLFKVKRNNWSLFLGHLVIEKLIKAYFVRVNLKHPPFIHDLLKLMSRCNVNLSEKQEDILDMITTFNINARYDDYKLAFFKRCTYEFTIEWIQNIKEIRKWIIEELFK